MIVERGCATVFLDHFDQSTDRHIPAREVASIGGMVAFLTSIRVILRRIGRVESLHIVETFS